MKRLYVFLLFFGTVIPLFAQQGGRIQILEDTPEAYGVERPVPKKPNKKGRIPANIIKFPILSPVRGDYGLLYERRIVPWFSVQVGLGYTSRDKIFERFTSGTFNSPNFKPGGGFSAKFGLRFYPIADGWMSGIFFSPDFNYREYNLTANLVQYDKDNNPLPQQLKCGYSFKEYRLNVGQSYDFLLENLYVEYYIGMVFREITESVPQYQNGTEGAYYTRTSQSRFLPGIAFNASIGYAF